MGFASGFRCIFISPRSPAMPFISKNVFGNMSWEYQPLLSQFGGKLNGDQIWWKIGHDLAHWVGHKWWEWETCL